MKTMPRPARAVLVILVCAARAEAHQLDEYLQATRLDFSRDRLVVDLSLTPGASIAPQIVALIDRDADGSVSPAEIESYAGRVLADVRLTLDGLACPLTLTKVVSPAWDDTREGLGTIRLEAVARGIGGGAHRIAYQNTHEPVPSVYSVNALKPSGNDVMLGAQHRDPEQHRIEIDVEIGSDGARAAWSASAFVLIGALLIVRWERRRPACTRHALTPIRPKD